MARKQPFAWISGLALAAMLAACSTNDGDSGAFGHRVDYAAPPDPDPKNLPLPKDSSGAIRLTPGTPVEIGWVPPKPGPMTALAACTRWVAGCVHPPERTVDDCTRSIPTCTTKEPWNEPACCPAACLDRYTAARKGGAKEIDAFNTAYFDRKDACVPGVSALLVGAP